MKLKTKEKERGARVAMYALAAVAMAALFAVPEDGNPAWMAALVLSKTVAFAAGWGSYRLWTRQERRAP